MPQSFSILTPPLVERAIERIISRLFFKWAEWFLFIINNLCSTTSARAVGAYIPVQVRSRSCRHSSPQLRRKRFPLIVYGVGTDSATCLCSLCSLLATRVVVKSHRGTGGGWGGNVMGKNREDETPDSEYGELMSPVSFLRGPASVASLLNVLYKPGEFSFKCG